MSYRRRRYGNKPTGKKESVPAQIIPIEEIKANFIKDIKSIEGMTDNNTAEDFWNNNIQSNNKEVIQKSVGNVQTGMKVPRADPGLVSAIETFINKAKTSENRGKILAALMKIPRDMPVGEEGLRRKKSVEGRKLFVEGNTGNKDDARKKRSIFSGLWKRKTEKRKTGGKTRKKRKRRRTKKKRKRRRKKRRRTRK